MWLKLKEMSIKEFAEKIGKTESLVHKYLYGDVIPKHETIVKIYRVTLGAVTADDFHGLSYKLFWPDYNQDNDSENGLNADSFK